MDSLSETDGLFELSLSASSGRASSENKGRAESNSEDVKS